MKNCIDKQTKTDNRTRTRTNSFSDCTKDSNQKKSFICERTFCFTVNSQENSNIERRVSEGLCLKAA
nr:unnamed protein product [Callosobruchus analis]